MNAKEVISQSNMTLEERKSQYGEASRLFSDIAKRWSVTLGIDVKPSDVALCMIDLKVCRYKANKDHSDNIIDIVGYAAILSEL